MFLRTFGLEHLLKWEVNPVVVTLLLPIVIFISFFCVKLYYSRIKYTCTECHHTFYPKFFQTHIGMHEENGREQYCPHCRKITFCKYADKE